MDMKITRIYERVSTSEQDLTRQADIEKTAVASSFYIVNAKIIGRTSIGADMLNDSEWPGRYAVALNAGVNGVYLLRASLDVAFDDSGRQINPLTARLPGNVAEGDEAV